MLEQVSQGEKTEENEANAHADAKLKTFVYIRGGLN